MADRVRIGVIGAGANTRLRHLPGFQAIPGVEVVAVCNRSRASSERVAGEFRIPRVADRWQDIIESREVDAICIGTWPNMHARLVTAALRAGKHVLTEARMARSLAEAETMMAESQAHPRLVAQIVPAPMSLPFDATIRGLLHGGALGDLREVCITCTSGVYANSATPITWRQDHALSGHNTLVLGIYYEMVLRWLERGVATLIAEAAIHAPQRPGEGGLSEQVMIPDSVTVLGCYNDGARLIAHFSGVEPGLPRNEIRLNGSAAGLRLDLGRNELWWGPVGGKEELVDIPPDRRGEWRVEADFIASVREGRPVRLTDFATGVQYMRFTDAVWESWNARGTRVAV